MGAAVVFAVASASALGALTAPPAAAAQSPTAVFFFDANGALDGYGTGASGAWLPVTQAAPPGLAPPGAPVAAAVMPGGGVAGVFIGGDQAPHIVCWPGLTLMAVSPESFTPGSRVAVSTVGGRVTIAVLDTGSRDETIMQDSHDPCTDPNHPVITLSQHSVPWYDGAPVDMSALTDGSIGVFTSDPNGAVHGVWLSSTGAWSDYLLTPDAAIGVNGGIAVAPRSAASPAPGALSLFYPGGDGRIRLARPAENSGLVGDPSPIPWQPQHQAIDPVPPRPWDPVPDPWATAYDTTAAATLTATAALPGETDVSYVADDGSVVELSADGDGAWLSAKAVTSPGLAQPGAPIASSSTAADSAAFDDFCGTGAGRLYHVPIGPNGPNGPGGPAGQAGLLAPTTRLGAA